MTDFSGGKSPEPELEPVGIWSLDSPHRALFNVLLAIAVIAGSASYLKTAVRLHRVMMSTAPAAAAGVAPAGTTVEIPPIEPIPGTPTTVKVPWWANLIICFYVLVYGLLLALLAYVIGMWLEEQERRCRRRRPRRWWQRLLCWLATILKWISYVVAILTVIAAIILTILCLIFLL